ncbi:hypothetical protein ACQKWADRAFT_290915 [Trichoderma austrokoningii]
MLAVRQPPSRMGSSQPDSDPFQMPFGYSVDGAQEPIFDAPEPAPGAPLLSETDSKFLSDFFDDMTANQYNMPSFGEGLNYHALFDLPPQLMGTATSYGSQPTTPLGHEPHLDYSIDSHHSHVSTSGSHLMPPPPPPPPPSSHPQLQLHSHPHLSQPASYQQHPSDDVLNAAATLMQNGSGLLRGAHKNNDPSASRRSLGPPVGHLRHQPLEEFREESRRGMVQTEVDNTFTEWMWGSKGRQNSIARPISVDYQWGSDSNFNLGQGYTPEANKETVETMQQEQLKCLECLEPNKSAATTRPSSPTNSQSTFAQGVNREASETREKPGEDGAPPRKRRKSKIKKDIGDDDENENESSTNGTKSATGKRRKAKGERNGSVSSPPMDTVTGGKRRKSSANGAKSARENLSEEQKRENHIRSEQKRRTLIKEGFDDLCDLVPGLRGGGFSKSTMLTMTAEWLEEILVGNKELTAQLAALEGR